MKKIACSVSVLILLMSFTIFKKEVKPVRTFSKAKMDLFTSQVWIYDEYFTNYNEADTRLAFKREKDANTMDLSINIVKFNEDGTYRELNENGRVLIGTWKFLDNENGTEVINEMGTFTSKIISLTENGYTWYDEEHGRYARMIPQGNAEMVSP